ncbi:MAG: hypothetical protein ACYDC7_02720 [Acidithiobacillus ferrivorans]
MELINPPGTDIARPQLLYDTRKVFMILHDDTCLAEQLADQTLLQQRQVLATSDQRA